MAAIMVTRKSEFSISENMFEVTNTPNGKIKNNTGANNHLLAESKNTRNGKTEKYSMIANGTNLSITRINFEFFCWF